MNDYTIYTIAKDRYAEVLRTALAEAQVSSLRRSRNSGRRTTVLSSVRQWLSAVARLAHPV